MGNYPTQESTADPNFDPFAQTYGSMTDEYSQYYSHSGGQEVQVEKGSFQICKIYSMDGGIFFFDKNHEKKMLTEQGKLLPNAKEIVKGAKGYGNPMVWVGGSLDSPTYMCNMTDPNVDHWEMVSFKSWKGLSHAVTGLKRDPLQQDTYHRQRLGSASINVFEEHRASTMFLDGMKFTKAIEGALQGSVSMMIEGVLDVFTMGMASPIIETTGLARIIDSATEEIYEKQFASKEGSIVEDFDSWASQVEGYKDMDESHNKIIDERIPMALEKVDKMATDFGLDVLDYSKFSPRSKVTYLHRQSHAVTIKTVDQKTAAFKKSLNITKHLTPGVDISMFDFSGRMTPEQRLTQLNTYAAQFQKNVMPSLKDKYLRMQKSGELPSLKVKPTEEPVKEEKVTVEPVKEPPPMEKTRGNITNTGKIISGQSNKKGYHVNFTVNG